MISSGLLSLRRQKWGIFRYPMSLFFPEEYLMKLKGFLLTPLGCFFFFCGGPGAPGWYQKTKLVSPPSSPPPFYPLREVLSFFALSHVEVPWFDPKTAPLPSPLDSGSFFHPPPIPTPPLFFFFFFFLFSLFFYRHESVLHEILYRISPLTVALSFLMSLLVRPPSPLFFGRV